MVGKSAVLRWMARKGLFVLVAMLVFAPAMAGAADMVFPFLGDPGTQANSARQGFLVQWALFAGLSGNNGSPLYFLALTAVLIGGMLVVFNQKFQNVATLGPWFMLVIVMIFAPYNSRLLFTPIEGGDCAQGVKSTTEATAAGSIGGGVCGFTPQVVAMHVGNVISVLMREVIKDTIGGAQVQAMMNQMAVVASPIIRNPPPEAIADLKAYNNQCRDVSLEHVSAWMNPDSATAAAIAKKGSQPRLGQAVDQIYDYYAKMDSSTKGESAAYPAIVLYTKKPTAWEPAVWDDYRNGLQQLYNGYSSTSDKYVTDKPIEYPATQISIPAAVDFVLSKMRSGGVSLGWDFVSGGAYYYIGKSDNPDTPAFTDQPLIDLRKSMAGKGGWTGIKSYFDSNKDNREKPALNYLRILKDNAGGEALWNMPVGVANFEVVVTPVYTTMTNEMSISEEVATGSNASVSASQSPSGNDCLTLARATAKKIMVKTLTENAGSADENNTCWDPLVKFIFDNQPLPTDATGGAVVYNTSCSGSGMAFAGPVKQLMANSGYSRDAGIGVLKQILASAAIRGGNTGSNPMSVPDNIGIKQTLPGGFVDSGTGWVASIGKAVVGAIGYLSGLKAAVIVQVLKSLIEIAFIGLVVVTPIMFLMGLLIPSNAMGMLITVTMGILVLRLVPATLVVVDAVVGLVLQGISASSSGVMDQFYMTGITLYAVAGMYSGIIGLTMLIMFKLGSADNFTKLQQLDNAADQIANTGINIARALATTLGPLAGAGLLSAVAGMKKGHSENAYDKSQEFKGDAAAQKSDAINGRMGQMFGGAATDTMTPPPGVDPDVWRNMSPEQRAKAFSDYELRPDSIAKDDWDAMSFAERSDAIKANWSSMTDDQRNTAVATQMAKEAYLKDTLAKAETDAKNPSKIGTMTPEAYVASKMAQANEAWNSGALKNKSDLIDQQKGVAGDGIRSSAVAMAKQVYGDLPGDGKSHFMDRVRGSVDGFKWGLASGLRGGWEAFGEVSAIPGVKIISEIMNEGKQGPMRAAAAKAMAMKQNKGKKVSALATMGIGPVGGTRGDMETAAAKQKYFEQEVGLWGGGMAAMATNKGQAIHSAVAKAGEVQATSSAFAASGLANMTTAQAVMMASPGAQEKMASQAANLKWLQELDKHLNQTLGKGIGQIAAAAGAEKGRMSAFESTKGSYLVEAKARAFRKEFNINNVHDELDINSSIEDITEAVKDTKKKGTLKKALARRAQLMAGFTEGDDEMFVDVVKAGVPQAVASAKRRGASFSARKYGVHSFINPLDGFMGQGQSTINGVLRKKPDLGNPNSRVNLAAINSAFSEALGEAMIGKIKDGDVETKYREDDGKAVMGVNAKKFEAVAREAFDLVRTKMSQTHREMVQHELKAFEEVYMARIQGQAASADGLFVFDDMKTDKVT